MQGILTVVRSSTLKILPYIQHHVPDDCGGYTLMGVVTEEAQEYMVPTVPHGGVVKNENEYVCMSLQDQN